MFRLTRLQHPGSAARVRAVLWLALVALVLRALVPAGYMPNARALHDGRLEVTFCSASGDLSALTLALSSGDQGKSGHDTADSGALCPSVCWRSWRPRPLPRSPPCCWPPAGTRCQRPCAKPCPRKPRPGRRWAPAPRHSSPDSA